ncbi:hypothetical protein FRB93_009927 [Tulasnella sp. JGI-2019a]|nr:hypothetical protein FRB93_009927 [Tulasnella sp. JGI-2019a]
MSTHDQVHTAANGIAKTTQHVQFMIRQCLQAAEALETNIKRLSSANPRSMLQGYLDAEAVLGSLGTHADETLQMISIIHERTLYTRPIDILPDELLSYVFRLGVTGVAEGKQEEVRSLILHRDDGTSSQKLALPEIVAQVNRRWRDVATGDPALWSRIVESCTGPLSPTVGTSRTHRWLTLSQGLPLSVSWKGEPSIFTPHAERIEALRVEIDMYPSEVRRVIKLLKLIAPSNRLRTLYIECSRDTSYDSSPASTMGPMDVFNALHSLTLDNVELGWSWPILNLRSLRLRKLHIKWQELHKILISSLDLEVLSLNYLRIHGWNPTAFNNETDPFPVHHNLRTLGISYNIYLDHAAHHTPGSILQVIQAPSSTKLTVFVRDSSAEEVGLTALISNARESLENISIDLSPVSKLDETLMAITDPPPPYLKALALINPEWEMGETEYHYPSDISISRLVDCRRLEKLTLGGLHFPEGAMPAMVSACTGEEYRLAYVQTTDYFGGGKHVLKNLGVGVVDAVPWEQMAMEISGHPSAFNLQSGDEEEPDD